MRFIKFLIVLVLFLFCLLFFTQNKEALALVLPLKIDLFFENLQWVGMEVPYYFVALGCLAAGMLFATLFFLIDRIKLTYSIIEKKVKIARLESEVKSLSEQLEKAKANTEKVKKDAELDFQKNVETMRKEIEVTVKKEAGISTEEPEAKSFFGIFKKSSSDEDKANATVAVEKVPS